MMPKLRAKQLRNAAFYVMVVLMAALTLLPFLFMLSSSFKGSEAIRTIPIRWIPERPTLEGYIRVFNMPGFSFGRASLNSLFLALATTLVQVLSACMAAFVFAKLPFRGLGKLFGLYLATMMIPNSVTSSRSRAIFRETAVWLNVRSLVSLAPVRASSSPSVKASICYAKEAGRKTGLFFYLVTRRWLKAGHWIFVPEVHCGNHFKTLDSGQIDSARLTRLAIFVAKDGDCRPGELRAVRGDNFAQFAGIELHPTADWE